MPPPAHPAPGPTRRGFLGTLVALLAGTPWLGNHATPTPTAAAAATAVHPPPPPSTLPNPAGPGRPVAPATGHSSWLLNKVYVAGWQYHAGPVLPGRPVTPGEPITLITEPDNPHDPFAARLELRGQKIGYIPRTENHHLSRLLRAGADLSAHVLAMSRPADPPWRTVRIAVCLAG